MKIKFIKIFFSFGSVCVRCKPLKMEGKVKTEEKRKNKVNNNKITKREV